MKKKNKQTPIVLIVSILSKLSRIYILQLCDS